MQENFTPLIEEYNPNYCLSLEQVYGEGMMSEGGSGAIKALLDGEPIDGARILDFGCGLGGMARFLATNYDCHVTALDINPDMIATAQNSLDKHLVAKLEFVCYNDSNYLPFADNHFDMVISKGVITHVQYKQALFNQFAKVLKDKGRLIINDWLSPQTGHWGTNVKRMIEIEGLILHAMSPVDYVAHLSASGFELESQCNNSAEYAAFNQAIVTALSQGKLAQQFANQFGEQLRKDYIESYQAIATAMNQGELLVQTFKAQLSG